MTNKSLITSAVILKFVITLLFGLSFDFQNNSASLVFLKSKPINNDESRYATVAYHYIENGKFSYCSEEKHFIFSDSIPELRLTAYTPTFPVYLHILYQKLYKKFAKLAHNDVSNYDSSYYLIYKTFIIGITLLTFMLSVEPFRLTVRELKITKKWETVATISYILAPSLLIYVGLWVVYENIVTHLLVILFYHLCVFYKKRRFTVKYVAIGCLLALIPALLRPHTLVSILLIFIFVFLSLLYPIGSWKSNIGSSHFKTYFIILLVFVLPHSLIIYKNYKTIGIPVLSTQQANAFFLGHQPYTRGSWNGDSETKGSNVYKWRLQHIPDLESISDEAVMYAKHKTLAWDWIKNNPGRLIWLESRKIAMFFLPYNFNHLKVNIFNLMFNFGFIGCIGLCSLNIYNKKNIPLPIVFSLLAVIGGLFLTVYSFYNLRFISYTTPFLIICSTYFYYDVIQKIKIKR